MTIFVERLEQRIRDLKLTQEDAAARSGIGLRRLQRALASDLPPKLDLVVSLAKGLETSVAFLSGETDNPEPPPSEERLTFIEKVALFLERGDRLAAIRAITEEEQVNPSGTHPLNQKS